MQKIFQKTVAVLLLALFLAPTLASAHQPRITESHDTKVACYEKRQTPFSKYP